MNGIVLDYETKKPIEYVDIYNNTNFTSTNSDGKFLFITEQDSIKIRLMGYKTIYSTFEKIKSDTIFLESKFEVLDEIIVGNSNSIKNIYKEIDKNYPFTPHSESFFLRCVIKKNGEIVKLQDLNGMVNRKTLFSSEKKPIPKKNYEIEVLNMRKAGIKEKYINVNMFSFQQILDVVNPITLNTEQFSFSKIKSKNYEFDKYYFTSNSKNESKSEGYYLVNNKDNAIIEFESNDDNSNDSFIEKGSVKYRTTSFKLFISFKKNFLDSKYYVSKINMKAQLELINKNETTIYDLAYSWITLDNTIQEIKNKTSIKKDIFKLKKTYNSEFWKKQKYLLLTNEMSEFLEKLDDSEKEFKTSTNMKKE